MLGDYDVRTLGVRGVEPFQTPIQTFRSFTSKCADNTGLDGGFTKNQKNADVVLEPSLEAPRVLTNRKTLSSQTCRICLYFAENFCMSHDHPELVHTLMKFDNFGPIKCLISI